MRGSFTHTERATTFPPRRPFCPQRLLFFCGQRRNGKSYDKTILWATPISRYSMSYAISPLVINRNVANILLNPNHFLNLLTQATNNPRDNFWLFSKTKDYSSPKLHKAVFFYPIWYRTSKTGFGHSDRLQKHKSRITDNKTRFLGEHILLNFAFHRHIFCWMTSHQLFPSHKSEILLFTDKCRFFLQDLSISSDSI